MLSEMKKNALPPLLAVVIVGMGIFMFWAESGHCGVERGSTDTVLLFFYADWCAPCRMIKPVVRELAGELKGRVEVREIDVDESLSLSEEYKARGIPMFVVTKGGKEVARYIGSPSKKEMRAMTGH